MCAGNAVFFHTEVVSKSKIAREMLFYNRNGCASVRKVGGVRRRLRMCSPMVAYARLVSDRSAIGKCKCRWLNALEWWLPGGDGLRMVALCYSGMAVQVSMVVRCC